MDYFELRVDQYSSYIRVMRITLRYNFSLDYQKHFQIYNVEQNE